MPEDSKSVVKYVLHCMCFVSLCVCACVCVCVGGGAWVSGQYMGLPYRGS